MELPDEPEIVELLDAADGFGDAIVGFEDHEGIIVGQARLTRHAELGLERGLDMSDGIHERVFLGLVRKRMASRMARSRTFIFSGLVQRLLLMAAVKRDLSAWRKAPQSVCHFMRLPPAQ